MSVLTSAKLTTFSICCCSQSLVSSGPMSSEEKENLRLLLGEADSLNIAEMLCTVYLVTKHHP